jgi:hypothetical protein
MSSSILLVVLLLLLLFTLVYGIRNKNKTVIGISLAFLVITAGIIGRLIYTLESTS